MLRRGLAGWALNGLYLLLGLLFLPVLAYRMLVLKKNRQGWSQKLFGQVPLRTSSRPCLWIHAVSVGEVLQVPHLLRQLQEDLPTWDFVVSTTTQTGHSVATEKIPEAMVCYFPLDFTWAARRALKRIRPSAVLLVELELWPNFILQTAARKIPLILVNGRVSEKSFRGYRRIRWVMGILLKRFQKLLMQTETYAHRIEQLGAEPARIQVTGNLKFDSLRTDRHNPATINLRERFQIEPGERVFIAGSTQHPEEALALECYQQLRREFPDLRLILVPRHAERFEEVAQMIRDRELPMLRRSSLLADPEGRRASGDKPVILLDTLGELGACWGLAEIAFVGGSLNRRGGQNMIEPAAYAATLLFGPNTWNFKDITEELLRVAGAVVVRNGVELRNALRDFLRNPQRAQEFGERAQEYVLSQRGSLARTVSELHLVLNTSPAKAPEREAA